MKDDNIDKKIQLRADLHRQWAETAGNRINKDARKIFIQKNGKYYQQLCNAIERYDYLDNKLHFEHLKKLHSLTVEILGRMAGFVALWARDKEYVLSTGTTLKIMKENNDRPEDRKNTPRNYIAHFNFLTRTAENYSIMMLINALRKLMDYDRKLKNAVSKAIIDLFDRHGMWLKFRINEAHELVLDKISPKKIIHLGGGYIDDRRTKIVTKQVAEEYCKMCEGLLQFKK